MWNTKKRHRRGQRKFVELDGDQRGMKVVEHHLGDMERGEELPPVRSNNHQGCFRLLRITIARAYAESKE